MINVSANNQELQLLGLLLYYYLWLRLLIRNVDLGFIRMCEIQVSFYQISVNCYGST